eukprot:jgi/Botrbrau1/10486/Bobra.0133s0089.1
MDDSPARTIDDRELTAEEASLVCKRMFRAGFFLLPWMWCVNIWYFWPEFIQPQNRIVKKYLNYSAGLAVGSGLLLVAWILTYLLGGPNALGKEVYHNLNVKSFDISYLGLPF